jgi:hypothetical protein
LNIRPARVGLAAAICIVIVACGRVPGSSATTTSSQPTPSPTAGQCASGTRPAGRLGASLVYDSARSQFLLFGGDVSTSSSSGSSNETWIETGQCWAQVSASVSPPNRAYAAAAFDPIHNVTVFYGGIQAIAGKMPEILADTWLWDGSSWTAVQATPSPALVAPVGAFDIATSEFVVFGYPADGSPPQTWAWNGGHWSQLQPPTSPIARSHSSLSYDYSSRKLLLYGGFNDGIGVLNDTWMWDGATWTKANPSASPPPQSGSVLCSGPVVVLVRPATSAADTWTWRGTDWSDIQTLHSPPSRGDSACAFTGTETRVFSGFVQGSATTADEWSFRDLDWSALV